MSKKVDLALLIILDIGKHAIKQDKDEKSFFTVAKECATRIIERQILSQSSNLIGVILLGSENTKNEMAVKCSGAFRNIMLLCNLEPPTWQMIRIIQDLKPCVEHKWRGDWVDSLIVAADYFKNGISGYKIGHHKVILMTNFKSRTSLQKFDIDQIIAGFKEEKFELDIIGTHVFDESLKGEDIEAARKFVETTDGASATFEYALQYLLFHKKKDPKSMPWNVNLSIGPNINIPVSAYIRIKDEPLIKKWSKVVRDPVTGGASKTEGIMKNKTYMNPDNQAVVDSADIIKGYHYGQQTIPFSDVDETMLYASGEKSLIVYGFTPSSKIDWSNLNGDNLSYIFGRKGDVKAQNTIRCLVECLHELKLVAIARRVYNNGNAPKMYALMPVIMDKFDNDNYMCLSMIGLCYKDDIKYMTFPDTDLKSYDCTKEQVEAFKNLISAMDLKNSLPLTKIVSPSLQYVFDCIAYRALNPGKDLPKPRDEIMMLFNVPPTVAESSKKHIEELKNVFKMTKIEKKTKEKTGNLKPDSNNGTSMDVVINPENQAMEEDMPSVKLPSKNISISKIGTLDPVNDYKSLIESGKSLPDLSSQMIDAIENLVSCNLDGTYNNALSVMKFFREECVKVDPSYYNIWMQTFKKALPKHSKGDMLLLITSNKLDLILKAENEVSQFDSIQSDESQLYDNDTVPDATELTMDTEVDNLFD